MEKIMNLKNDKCYQVQLYVNGELQKIDRLDIEQIKELLADYERIIKEN